MDTRFPSVTLGTALNERGEAYMLEGRYGLAYLAFLQAQEHALTPEGRSVLRDKARAASAAMHARGRMRDADTR